MAEERRAYGLAADPTLTSAASTYPDAEAYYRRHYSGTYGASGALLPEALLIERAMQG